ncbi:hypothetical protein M758_2G062000 [Ceratodon purpureus]|nr:hypothetical protein M758_2G062000 [Ceratodon purpureus]
MALGAKSTHVRSEVGSTSTLPYPTKKRGVIPMTAEDSVAQFKRDRSNVRLYVRSSTQKLKWTRELHQSFMRAVNRLGGKDKATPKRILQHMDKDGITIAHIKSHLQMYRTGKINAEGLPSSATFSLDDHDPEQVKSNSKEISSPHLQIPLKEAREVHMALQFLKEGRISGAAGTETLLKGLADIQAFKRIKTSDEKMKQEDVKTHEFVLVPNAEPRPTSWSFFDETRFIGNAVDVTDSLSGRKRKAEEDIELDLTMATRSASPRIQFPCPSTPEEATLSLGLSS